MSKETELDLNDLESLIEYCPDSPEVDTSSHDRKIVEKSTTYNYTTRIILVCILCFRKYDLEADLRGHLIEYHKYRPIRKILPVDHKNKSIIKKNKKNAKKVLTSGATLDSTINLASDGDIRPVPFKDFRLILRNKLILNCTESSSCSYKFENEQQLQQHLKCHITASNTFKCYICCAESNNWRRCSTHLWKVHKLDVDLLKCPICEYKSHASVLVWRHMRVHKKWRNRVMRSLMAVKERRRKAAEEEASLKKEAEDLKKSKYYSEKTCNICNRIFVNGKTLSRHIKIVHNKIKPFVCNVCGKKSARKDSLIIHMRQHTGEKPLQCKACKFSTRDPSVLHKHQLRHDKVAHFKCPFCSYSCIQSISFKRHMRLFHNEHFMRISCDMCKFVTVSEQKLKAHKEDHRKGLIDNNEDFTKQVPKPLTKITASTDCFVPVNTDGVTTPSLSNENSHLHSLLK